MLPCPRGKPWLTRLSAQEVTTLDFRIPEHGSQVNDRNPLSMTLGYDMLRHDATCVGTDGEIVGTLVRQKLFASGLWISMLEEWWCIFVSMALNTLDKVNLTSGNEWIYMGYGLLMFTV